MPAASAPSFHVPTLRDVVYSSKAFVASVLALVVGFSQNLDNPYWAVLTVYVVVNPPGAGAIRSKALFRLLGTVVGGLVVIVLTGWLANQISTLVVATIATIAGAMYLQHIDKTPTNYIWFAIAVTISVIALNNLNKPESIFDITTARVGEISLGILSIAFVDSLWPEPQTPKFLETMGEWRGKARAWLVDALRYQPARQDHERRQAARDRLSEIIEGVAAIDERAIQLPFDVVPNAPRKRYLDLLRRQVVATIGDLIAVEFRIGALHRGGQTSVGLQRHLDAVGAWVCDAPDLPGAMVDAHVARGEALAEELETAGHASHSAADRHILIEGSLLARLAGFTRDWCELSLVLRSIATGRELPPRLDQIAKTTKPVRSIDYLGGALNLLPMLLAMTVTATIWYLTAWGDGPTALLFAWAGTFFLLGKDEILKTMGGMFVCILFTFLLVLLYQFVILPRVTDFPILVISLGFLMVPFGIVMAMNMLGMLILALFFSFLALQNVYRADFAQTLQTLSGVSVGMLIAVIALRLCNYDRAEFATRRLAAAVRRDVLDVARQPRLPDSDRFLFLSLYRLSLYFTAAKQVAAKEKIAPRLTLISDSIIGYNLLALRRHEVGAVPATRRTIEKLRDAAVQMFDNKHIEQPDNHALRAQIDAALIDSAIHVDPERETLINALLGLELALRAAEVPVIEKADR